MPSILIISSSEITYNARLLKAAEVFKSRGFQVTVYNPITGLCPEEIHRKTIQDKDWDVIENDISKRTLSSWIRWFVSSLAHLIICRITSFWVKNRLQSYFMNKGLILAPSFKAHDYILIHLVDNLPYAVKLSRKMGAKLIYDSQEYFVGQYQSFDKRKYNWVKRNQELYIKSVDYLLATTNVMKETLIADYNLDIPTFRVRNLPLEKHTRNSSESPSKKDASISIVWHGMSIFFHNRRGLDVLMEAMSLCKSNVELTLQGNINPNQKDILNQLVNHLHLKGRIHLAPAAHPEQIISSLRHHDVGVTTELTEEMNQELTSSNKLFDYIHAGLAVVSSNTLGLAETLNEYNVGYLYESGSAEQLANKLDFLAEDQTMLENFKERSRNARKSLYWENDYNPFIDQMVKGR